MKHARYKTTTRLVHGPDHSAKWDFSHHVTPPLSSCTTYRLDSVRRGARGFAEFGRHVKDVGEPPVYVYDRLDEPTRSILEGELAEAEGGDACVTFSSGMAAISAALLSVLRPGDEVIAHPVVYGCTHSLFENWMPRFCYPVESVDLNRLDLLRERIGDATRILYLETPTNPTLELIDIAALRALADEINRGRPTERRLLIYVDNTFATPFGQRPLEHGADVVVHSLTKNIGGFGTEIGGAVICGRWMVEGLRLYRKDLGGVLASKSAWSILVYGLPTLALRLKRQQYSALKVASWLEEQEWVESVFYPGLDSFPQRALAERQQLDFDGDFAPGNMIYMELATDAEHAEDFVDALASDAYSITLAVSLGHTNTLIEMPGRMTHSIYAARGERLVPQSSLRLSIGLESPDDIIADLEEAARKVELAKSPAALAGATP